MNHFTPDTAEAALCLPGSPPLCAPAAGPPAQPPENAPVFWLLQKEVLIWLIKRFPEKKKKKTVPWNLVCFLLLPASQGGLHLPFFPVLIWKWGQWRCYTFTFLPNRSRGQGNSMMFLKSYILQKPWFSDSCREHVLEDV